MEKNEFNDAVQQWLDDHENDDVGVSSRRHVIPDSIDEIVETDTPEETERKKVREFSLRWGWIWDLSSALYWYAASWFTTDVLLGLFRAGYGLIMAGLLLGIIYSLYVATENGLPVRTLPTVEELQQPAHVPDEKGLPYPTEGQ